jgi:hypothetical protein
MAYLADLEVIWQKAQATRKKSGIDFRHSEHLRSKSLRGPDLLADLLFFQITTGDQRFGDAINALQDNGIMDAKGKLNAGWKPPMFERILRNIELLAFRAIKFLMEGEDGQSLHRACAETAAAIGHQAGSFNAAIKDLQTNFRKEEPSLEHQGDYKAGDYIAVASDASKQLHEDVVKLLEHLKSNPKLRERLMGNPKVLERLMRAQHGGLFPGKIV